jgi:hypothetical protein
MICDESVLPPTRERDGLLAFAVSQWATDNFAAAADWAAAIPDSNLRQEMIATVAVAAAAENASAAATLIANALGPGETQDRVAVSIIQHWAQVSPLDAAAWLSEFPEIPVRNVAMNKLVALWAMRDHQAAANWITALSDGSFKNSAIDSFATYQVQFSDIP